MTRLQSGGAVAKARNWLAELRRARDTRDKDAFIDLLTAIALAAPALQGAACEIARGFGDEDGDRWEEWAKGFFISRIPKSEVESKVVEVAPPARPGLQRFNRRLGEAPQIEARKIEGEIADGEVADALEAAVAKLGEERKAEPEEEVAPKSGTALLIPSNELLVPVVGAATSD